MTSLSVRMLGPFRIWRNDELIPTDEWPTQKAKTLLKLLLVERGRLVPSDRLIELIWPDLDLDAAANSLRVAVSQLRGLLEPDLDRPAESQFILTRSEGYLFDVTSDVSIDIDMFLDAFNRGQHWTQRSEWGPAIAAYRAAEDQFHGDFLEEDSYAEWALGERERLRDTYLALLTRLAFCQAQLGNYDRAAAACEKVLARDPLREEIYRSLMVYRYWMGQRDRAVRIFERCRRVLTESLGVEPMPETRKIHLAVLRGEQVTNDALLPRQASRRQRHDPSRIRSEDPFVGRDAELGLLGESLREAAAGRGRLLFITGEAGVGKTRLVEDFLVPARGRGAVVLQGQCNEAEQDLAFRPVRQAIRPYLLQRIGPSQAREMLGPWAPHVALVLPEVQEVVPNVPPMKSPSGNERQQLLDGLSQFLVSISRRYPLVLAFDDLHWADPSTLQLLRVLTRHLGQERVLILGTYRDDMVNADDPLKAVERSLLKEGQAERLELQNLSQEAVTALVSQAAAAGWDSSSFSRRLYEETEGNPLYLTELIRDLRERRELIVVESGGWRPKSTAANLAALSLRLPDSVQLVIQSRLQAASESARRALNAAAVIGQRFEYQLLELACQLDSVELLDGLDELLDRKLIQEHSKEDSPSYAFTHEQIRTVVYEKLSRARRTHLHLNVAQALEGAKTNYGDEVYAQLATHFGKAGVKEQSLHYRILAGEHAARQYAHPEARKHFARALELAAGVDTTEEQILALYSKLGRILELESEYEDALDTYQELEEVAQQRNLRSMELSAIMAQVTMHATFTAVFDPGRAEELAERAIDLAHELQDQAAEAKLLWNLSLLYRNTNRIEEAIDAGERSLSLSRELGLKEQTGFALHDLAAAYIFGGRVDQAVGRFKEVRDLWHELDNLPMLADSLAALSQVYTVYGEFDRAIASAEQAFDLSLSIDNIWGQVNSRGWHLGFIHWERGRADKAIKVTEDCLRLVEEAGLATVLLPRACRGFVYGELGAVERSLADLRRAEQTADERVRILHPAVLAMLAQIHLLVGNLNEAEAAIEQGAEEISGEMSLPFLERLKLAEAQLALARGDDDQTLKVIEELLADVERRGAHSYIPEALYIQGSALISSGQIDKAGNCLQRAQVEAESLGSRRMLWQILTAIAHIDVERGRDERARSLRRQARQILEYIANHAPTPELRATFLARTDAQELLAHT